MFVDDAGFDDVAQVCAALCATRRGGIVLGDLGYSVGPWELAVRAGEDAAWAVLDHRGAPVFVAFDAFEVARVFCDLEAGLVEEDEVTPRAIPDALFVAGRRYEKWLYTYRFVECGDPSFVPENPWGA